MFIFVDFLDAIVVAVVVVVVVVVDIVFVLLEGGRDASSDPPGAGNLKDISELKKGYPSIRRFKKIRMVKKGRS